MPRFLLMWTINGEAKTMVVATYQQAERQRKNIERRRGYDVDSYRAQNVNSPTVGDHDSEMLARSALRMCVVYRKCMWGPLIVSPYLQCESS